MALDYPSLDEEDTGSLESQLRRRPKVTPDLAVDNPSFFDDGFDADNTDIADDESFTSPSPARAADAYARRRDTVPLEDQLRKSEPKLRMVESNAALPDYSSPEFTDPVTGKLATTVKAPRPTDMRPSGDIESTFDDLGQKNSELFYALKPDADPSDPARQTQYNQLRFFSRVQSQYGGWDKFSKAPAAVKNAYIERATDDQMRELFPGYGKGQKLPKSVTELRRSVKNDIKMGLALSHDMQGLPKQATSKNTLLGASSDETISHVLMAPEFDKATADKMSEKDREAYIKGIVNIYTDRKDPQTRARILNHLAPLMTVVKDPDTGEVTDDGYATQTARVFAPKDEEGNAALPPPPPAKDPNQSWSLNTLKSLGEHAGDIARTVSSYIGGPSEALGQAIADITPETAKYILAQPLKAPAAPAALVGAAAKVTTGKGDALMDLSRAWSEGVDSLALTEEGKARQKAIGEKQSEAIKNAPTWWQGAYDAVKVMASDPKTSLEQVGGTISELFFGGKGLTKLINKGVEKTTGKAVTETAKRVTATSASATIVAEQTQTSTLQSLLPDENTPAYDIAKLRYSQSEQGKARKEAAKAGGYEYDLDADFKDSQHKAAAAAGLVAALATVGTSFLPGSIEKVMAGQAGKATVAGTAATTLTEALSEGFEEYVTAVTQSYFDKVQDEYGKTGDIDKLVRSMREGQALAQAGVGAVLGGAVGSGFRILGGIADGPGGVDAAGDGAKAVTPDPTTLSLDEEIARADQFEKDTLAQQIGAERDRRSVEQQLAAKDAPAPDPNATDPTSFVADAEQAVNQDTFDQAAAGREQRSLEAQLSAREPTAELSIDDYVKIAENDGNTQAIDAELATLDKSIADLDTQIRKKPKDIAGVRERTQLNIEQNRLKSRRADLAKALDEITNAKDGTGRYTKVTVRDADGNSTGVKMDRPEFEALVAKQRETLNTHLEANARADKLIADSKATLDEVKALTDKRDNLHHAMLADKKAIIERQVQVASDNLKLAKDALDMRVTFMNNLQKGRTAEEMLSSTYKKTFATAKGNITKAKARVEQAQAALHAAQDVQIPSLTAVRKTDEFRAEFEKYDQEIAAKKAAAKLLEDEAKASRAAGDQIKAEFKSTEGFDPDARYTNRQADVAQNPISDTSLQHAISLFGNSIQGVQGVGIDVRVIHDQSGFDAAHAIAKLPSKSFSTLARTETVKGQPPQNVIYVNRMRIEEGSHEDLARELASKAAAQFVLPHIAASDNQFKLLLRNIARSALKTKEGRRIHAEVSDGFYRFYKSTDRTGTPDIDAFRMSFVAEIMRQRPDGLRRTFRQRAAVAVSNFLSRRFPRLANKLGVKGTTADIGVVNKLMAQVVRTDANRQLGMDLDGDWKALLVDTNLDRQRREFVNQSRYTGGIGGLLQSMKDRQAATLAVQHTADKVRRGVVEIPTGLTQDEALAKLDEAENSVELRVRRVDNRVRTEAEPLINEFTTAIQTAASRLGQSSGEFTAEFDTYVQLLSMQEMLSTTGDYYLAKVKLSKDGKAAVAERMAKLDKDQQNVHDRYARERLGREARADVEAIVAKDQLGKPPQKLKYAGLTYDEVVAELQDYERNTPARKAAFDEVYPVFRKVMDRVTETSFESGKYDPLDIAFRARKHFVFRKGQVVDASKLDAHTESAWSVIGGRKSLGGADETFSASARRDIPKNASVEATDALIRAIEMSELAKTAKALEIVGTLDRSLYADGKKAQPQTISTPVWSTANNFDFEYIGSPKEGSSKSIQFLDDQGRKHVITLAHEDVMNGLRQHSVMHPALKIMAEANGVMGSLYTTRNPAFVLTRQAPRDLIHNTFAIIMPRHGVRAAARFNKNVLTNMPSIWRYARLDAEQRQEMIRKLPANHPLKRYVAQGAWFGAHAQHSAADLASKFAERGFAERITASVPYIRTVLDAMPEAADNLFRLAYFDTVTDAKTENNLKDEQAAVRAGKLMDFSSGSALQRSMAPWMPFARAWVNGAYNLMAHDLWQNGSIPTKQIMTVDGSKAVLDLAAARQQFNGVAALMQLGMVSAAMYALSRVFAGPDDEPPSADELTNGLMLPGGYKLDYQYGPTKIFGSLGSLAYAVSNGDVALNEAGRAFFNVWLKEASPLGLQYVPSSGHAHWLKTMISQAAGSNIIGKFTLVPAINVDGFGRKIISTSGLKPSTPDAYAAVNEANPDLAAYTLRQFGYMSAIIDYAFRANSANQTEDDLARAKGKLTGFTSFQVGDFSKRDRIEDKENALVDGYAAQKVIAQRSGKAAVAKLQKETPGASSMEAYLKLDRKLKKQHTAIRKKYAGRPELTQKVKEFEDYQARKRKELLDKIKQRAGA